MATNNSINSRELIKTNNLSDLTNAGTARTNLGLGSAAVVATDLADLNEATIESAIDTLANLTSIQGRTVTLADAGANAVFGWDDVAGAYENLTASEVRGAIGLATSDSPQFTGIELGHASDTTLARVSAGVVSIEGVTVATATNTLTLSGKTLTEPKFADLGFIADANGNELIILDTVTSAVNEVTFANAATGANPNFSATGGDTNVGIDFTPKGTGFIQIKGNSTQAGTLAIYEDTDDGSNYSAFRGSARAGNIIYTMPTADPTAGQVLSAGAPSGGVSALSWATAGGGSGWVLVDNSTFSGATTATINDGGANLDGNTDEMYMIVVRCIISTGDRLVLRANNASTTYGCSYTGINQGSAVVESGGITQWRITGTGNYTNHQFTAYVSTKTAQTKILTATSFSHDGSTNYANFNIGGYWDDTATAITSFTLLTSGGSATFSSGSEYWIYKAV